MGAVSRSLWHTLVYACAISVNRGLAFLLLPIYTRVLGKSEYAVWELCMTTVLFLEPLMDLGMAAALMRYYFHYDSKEERRATFNTCFGFLLLVQGVTIGALAFLARPLSVFLFDTPDRSGLLLLVAVLGSLTILGNQPLAWFRAQERSLLFTAMNFARAAVGPPAILLLLWYFDKGVPGILWGDMFGIAVMTAAGFVLCGLWVRPKLQWRYLKPLLALGLPLLPAAFALTLLSGADRYFLNAWVGEEAVAVYGVGAKVAIIVQLLARALQTAYPPAAISLSKEPEGPAMIAKMLRLLMVAVFVGALALAALGPEIVWLLGGAEYRESYQVVPLVVLAFALRACINNVLTSFVIIRKTIYNSIVACTGGALVLLLHVILIPAFGILGAAWAVLLAFVFQMLFAYALTQRFYPLPHDWRRLGALWLAATAALGGMLWGGPLPTAQGLPLRLATLLAFVLVCVCFVATRRERRQAWRALVNGAVRIRGWGER